MKRILLAVTFATAIAAGGVVAAQAPAAKSDEHAAHHPAAAAASAAAPGPTADPRAAKAEGMMCAHMMGGGMMGPLLGGPNTKIDVKKIDKGVTITLTATDPAAVTRLQKMAEAMRLMHEAMAQ